MGQELIQRGIQTKESNLWSATALMTSPESVLAIHQDYINAGAEVITTNTYTTIKSRLASEDLEHRFQELNSRAGALARQAQQQADHQVYVAGCLPPLWRSDRPELVEDAEQAEQLYSELIEQLDPYVDLYIAETMSTAQEAIGAARAVASCNKPLLVSWTLMDDGSSIVRNGQDVLDILKAVAAFPIAAYLFNCCAPESISRAIVRTIAFVQSTSSNIPVGGYANGFTPIPQQWQYQNPNSLPDARDDLDPQASLAFVKQWLSSGAHIVGGCCEVGPTHIQAIRQHLQETGATLS